jgi:trehalose 6-phosphate phosphatase
MACELRPPVDIDKGAAFRSLADEFDHKAFAGDDHGDIAAFEVEFGEPPYTSRAVNIAVRSPESPPELLERADVVVNGPTGLAALLTELAAAVSS